MTDINLTFIEKVMRCNYEGLLSTLAPHFDKDTMAKIEGVLNNWFYGEIREGGTYRPLTKEDKEEKAMVNVIIISDEVKTLAPIEQLNGEAPWSAAMRGIYEQLSLDVQPADMRWVGKEQLADNSVNFYYALELPEVPAALDDSHCPEVWLERAIAVYTHDDV